MDAFRTIGSTPSKVEVKSADLQIDAYSGKEVISLQIQIHFGNSEKINYIKTHKDVKNIVLAHGHKWQKLKYFSKDK